MQLKVHDIHKSLGYLTGRTHRLVRDAVGAELKACGVEFNPSNIPVIGTVAAGGGIPVVQRDLVDRLDMDRHRISRAVRELADEELILLTTNPKNKRENLLELTPKGRELFDFIGAIAFRVIEKAFEGCTPEERRITEQTLQKITRNLSQNEH